MVLVYNSYIGPEPKGLWGKLHLKDGKNVSKTCSVAVSSVYKGSVSDKFGPSNYWPNKNRFGPNLAKRG